MPTSAGPESMRVKSFQKGFQIQNSSGWVSATPTGVIIYRGTWWFRAGWPPSHSTGSTPTRAHRDSHAESSLNTVNWGRPEKRVEARQAYGETKQAAPSGGGHRTRRDGNWPGTHARTRTPTHADRQTDGGEAGSGEDL